MILMKRGSPPQVRGKLSLRAVLIVVDRITPAGAGKTISTAEKAIARWDHPRRCGENLPAPEKETAYPGSPPQVRGKHKVNQ